MKLIMENWRQYLSEGCDSPQEFGTGSVGSAFDQDKMINDSYKMVVMHAPSFIKKSPYKDDVKYLFTGKTDSDADEHLKDLYGVVWEECVDITINFMNIAYRGDTPEFVEEYLHSFAYDDAKALGAPEMPHHDRDIDRIDDKTIMINMNPFYRFWRRGDCSKQNFLAATIMCAGTLVHEVAHTEDNLWYKNQQQMKSKIKEKFQQAMDDGLFDRDAHEIEVTDTDKSVASNIKIFLDALKEEFDILAAHMLAATEIFAYNAEILFYKNLLALYKNSPDRKWLYDWITGYIAIQEEHKSEVALDRVAKYLPKSPKVIDLGDVEITAGGG